MWSCQPCLLQTVSQSGRSSQVTCLCSAPWLRGRGHVAPPCFLQTPPQEEFFSGSKVLARNQRDGLYHQGTVLHKVQSCRGLWVVEFYGTRQLLCSLDMIRFDQTGLPSVQPGNTVLCPVGPETRSQNGQEPGLKAGLECLRFGPGRVVSLSQEDGAARVLMWDSCVSLVPVSSLCPLPLSIFHRLRRELQLGQSPFRYIDDQSARQSSFCYPDNCSTPHSPFCYPDNHITCPLICLHGNRASPSLPCPCCCCRPLRSQARTKPGPTETEPDLRSSPGFTSDLDQASDDDEDQAESSPEFEFECQSIDRRKAREQRPQWRYWRRTGPEPHHKKPGGAVTWRTHGKTPQISYVTFPSPQRVSSANHSSVFQPLTNHMREGGLLKYKPSPPQNTANQRPRPQSVNYGYGCGLMAHT